MLCIDGDCDVTVCYCNDTDDWAPPAGTSFVWDVLIRSGELLSILDTVAGLGLDLHKSKERMTNCILAQLNGLIYKMHNPNGHVMLLAAVIDRLTMQGIRDFAERMANKRLQPIYRPELN